LSAIVKALHFNSIANRIAVTIVLAIVVGIAVEIAIPAGLAYFGSDTHVIVSRTAVLVADPNRNAQMLSSKVATMARVLAPLPETERQKIIEATSEPKIQIALHAAPLPEVPDRDDSRLGFLRQLIELQLEELSSSMPVTVRRLPANGSPRTDFKSTSESAALIEIALPDHRWLSITALDYPVEVVPWRTLMLRLCPLFVVIGLLSIWMARRLAAPIRDFARAAERLGVDMTAPPLAERGPHELRMAIRTFNIMQERLRRFLADRTQMLAAISHDLRAPLARLRLRAEFVEDAEQQLKMFGDLEAMNAMIDTTLAFARDDARQEPRRLVDLGVLVGDVCEDVADSGSKVSYFGPRGVDVMCRPSAIRRAVANLIDNAAKYGRSVQVRIVGEAERIVVVIDDDGPGIPEEEKEKVFAPFYRLEPSRDPDKGGVGLGLSVARTIAREHGGDVTLANGADGGLRVRLELPV
jgi:signal transduction histidine kinase